MEVNDNPEDDKVGGLESAVDMWLTTIRYTSAIHTPLVNHFGLQERKAHADKCAAAGKSWALSINEHTSNTSLWQYVHDAYAHIWEGIMDHGAGDRNDDAILEKANRRKKRLGDRCVMRGGINFGTWQRTIRVPERDASGQKTGRFVKKTHSRVANLGQAAQVQKLDLIAQITESNRLAASAKYSAKELEFKDEQKVMRDTERTKTESAVENYMGKRAADMIGLRA